MRLRARICRAETENQNKSIHFELNTVCEIFGLIYDFYTVKLASKYL